MDEAAGRRPTTRPSRGWVGGGWRGTTFHRTSAGFRGLRVFRVLPLTALVPGASRTRICEAL